MNSTCKPPQSIDRQIFARISKRGRGSVFTPAEFLDLGRRSAVDTALARAAASGRIRRLARGVYDYPKRDAELGLLLPSTPTLVKALQGRAGIRVQPSGAHAANLLGLSEQVPLRLVFLTDGPSRVVRVGRRELRFKHTTPRHMATAGRISGTVIQALRWLGARHMDRKLIANLQRTLSATQKRQLLRDVRYAPAWIADVMRQVAAPVRDTRGSIPPATH